MKVSAEKMPMCCNCKHGKLIPVTNDVLCPINGVVSSNYSCSHYSYNLFLIKSKRKRKIDTEQFTFDDFSITDTDSQE